MRAAASRFPRARWPSTKRSAARASSACRSPASPTAIISASPRGTWHRSRSARMVGLAFGNSPAAMPDGGRQARAVRHQSDRRRLSARAAPPLVDRPFAVRSRARQGDGGGEGGHGRFRSAGRSMRDGQPTTDAKAALAGLDARDGRHEGRDAGARRRVARHGADRRGDGLRGELVLRRRRQPTAHRPGVPRRSIRMRSPAARRTSSASRRSSPPCSTTKAYGCPARAAQRLPSAPRRRGVDIAPALLQQLQVLAAS